MSNVSLHLAESLAASELTKNPELFAFLCCLCLGISKLPKEPSAPPPQEMYALHCWCTQKLIDLIKVMPHPWQSCKRNLGDLGREPLLSLGGFESQEISAAQKSHWTLLVNNFCISLGTSSRWQSCKQRWKACWGGDFSNAKWQLRYCVVILQNRGFALDDPELQHTIFPAHTVKGSVPLPQKCYWVSLIIQIDG